MSDIVTESQNDNGGWLKMLLSWDWHDVVLKGYPGWELRGDDCPHEVSLSIIKGHSTSSRDLAIAFDDVTEGRFYYRDWTESGLPFVDEGEVYQSRFWFQFKRDYDKFEAMPKK